MEPPHNFNIRSIYVYLVEVGVLTDNLSFYRYCTLLNWIVVSSCINTDDSP